MTADKVDDPQSEVCAAEVSRGWSAPRVEAQFAWRLLHAIPEAVCCMDLEGRLLFWNTAAERLTGFTFEAAAQAEPSAGPCCVDLSGAPLQDEDLPSTQCLATGRPLSRNVFIRRADGRRIWVEIQCSPVRNEGGDLLGCLMMLRDATSVVAISEALRQARRAAEIDPLTGLSNRRSLDRMLDIRLGQLASEGRPFCLLMTDIDRFKSINDTWGHAVGDRALVAFAELLQRQSRDADLVVRFGGEEFVILLPDDALNIAVRIAERLRAATASVTPPELGAQRLTASFGVAQAVVGETAAELVHRVDAALYRAKAQGRDRVEVDKTGTLESFSKKPCPDQRP